MKHFIPRRTILSAGRQSMIGRVDRINPNANIAEERGVEFTDGSEPFENELRVGDKEGVFGVENG